MNRQDNKAEAFQILRNTYEWFKEGFDIPDLKEAKVMMENLFSQ